MLKSIEEKIVPDFSRVEFTKVYTDIGVLQEAELVRYSGTPVFMVDEGHEDDALWEYPEISRETVGTLVSPHAVVTQPQFKALIRQRRRNAKTAVRARA